MRTKSKRSLMYRIFFKDTPAKQPIADDIYHPPMQQPTQAAGKTIILPDSGDRTETLGGNTAIVAPPTFCTQCGCPNQAEGSAFCANCGNKLTKFGM